MLYTRKGDSGTTKVFGCDQRLSKSSAIAEALGALDETNSFLGIIKTHADALKIIISTAVSKNGVSDDLSLPKIIHSVQENLFIIQAEVAGAEKHLSDDAVKEIESITDTIEKILPPINTFFISGGTNITAHLDTARTIARRAERRVVAVGEEGTAKLSPQTLAYLNRLSSLLYALARLSNHLSGINEQSPKY